MSEPIEKLLYDFLTEEEHPWRTWAKKDRAAFKRAGRPPRSMVQYFVEWRKAHG